ncbi:hypothetical protein LOCC1_G007511 [Lachnellula occidentalis]|uniref:Phosphoglycerate mutase family protein n=1 Tax=Lachnellula occidentalis TaxID=215460 RepID=A0A8H8RMD7_9HELO|nr:hypothetical protein LOCC1_G007511 [Lachnellula occidentalis]
MRTSILLAVTSLLSAISAQQTVYLIRHGEQPPNDGTGLSTEGQLRAQCLREVFGDKSGYNIDYIIAEHPLKHLYGTHRQRALDTVLPLAYDLGLAVDTSCDRDNHNCVGKLVARHNRRGKGNLLICWEHEALTDIARALGDYDAPIYYDDHYNLIWTDPYPYSVVTNTTTSEMCPGLDP